MNATTSLRKSWNLEELRSSVIHRRSIQLLVSTSDLSKSVSSTPKVTLEKEKKKNGNSEEKERRRKKMALAVPLFLWLSSLKIAFEREKTV